MGHDLHWPRANLYNQSSKSVWLHCPSPYLYQSCSPQPLPLNQSMHASYKDLSIVHKSCVLHDMVLDHIPIGTPFWDRDTKSTEIKGDTHDS